MPRKSTKMNLLDIEFEVVLIIILILVAIVMIIFLNRKVGNGQRNANNTQRQLNANTQLNANGQLNANTQLNANGQLNANNANNGAEEILESFNNRGSHVHVFYAHWCGHSRNYLETHHDNLLAMLQERNLHTRFTHSDVETEEGGALANRVSVKFLPSFYTEVNGEFTKFEFNNGINPEEIVHWLESN